MNPEYEAQIANDTLEGIKLELDNKELRRQYFGE